MVINIEREWNIYNIIRKAEMTNCRTPSIRNIGQRPRKDWFNRPARQSQNPRCGLYSIPAFAEMRGMASINGSLTEPSQSESRASRKLTVTKKPQPHTWVISVDI